ncbi:hypothetical protein PRZ48_012443 [Zasmidium cellare]|uniref:FAD-binding domain-containing protein n=1 Tax=Zasmidium cellare TaxID=395010 RepID=A0ABR0E5C1_ZASCE|nr:hypothetical protein PRZ48_012443 [Zasmidium cellare]
MSGDGSTGFSIAIVGGGIGGLFAALSIHHHVTLTNPKRSTQIDVYEQAAKYTEIGAGLGIGANAARLIHKLGLYDRLNAIGGNPDGKFSSPAIRRFDNGDEIFRWPVPPASTLIRQIPCSRSGTLDVFREAIEQRSAASLHTDKRCVRVEECGDKVTVHFSDVRDQFASDEANYSGQIAYRDVIPCSSLPAQVLERVPSIWLGQHKHFICYPISRGQELNMIAFVNKPDVKADIPESWTTTCNRDDVLEDFKDHEQTVQEVIRGMRERPSRWRLNDRDPLDTWHFMAGKVVLLGDAAHPMLPHLGAGCGQAMEDGWIIGRALSDYFANDKTGEPLNTVSALYQFVRQPRAHKAQSGSRIVGNTYDCQTEDLIDLTFDECIPIVAERVGEFHKWTWDEDLDQCYENIRGKAGLGVH